MSTIVKLTIALFAAQNVFSQPLNQQQSQYADIVKNSEIQQKYANEDKDVAFNTTLEAVQEILQWTNQQEIATRASVTEALDDIDEISDIQTELENKAKEYFEKANTLKSAAAEFGGRGMDLLDRINELEKRKQEIKEKEQQKIIDTQNQQENVGKWARATIDLFDVKDEEESQQN